MMNGRFPEVVRRSAAEGPSGGTWHRWVRSVAAHRGLGDYDEERKVMEMITDRLDSESGDRDGFVRLAVDIGQILGSCKDSELIADVVNLAVGRREIPNFLRKYLGGVVSRTAVLSYVAGRPWSSNLKTRMAQFETIELRELADALEDGRWVMITDILRSSAQ